VTSTAEDPDADLLTQVATGERAVRDAAFHELVERHRDRVHAICHRYFGDPTDAQDATQETFLTVLRRAGTFRGEAQVSTWLYRVAVNTCHDLARHRARRPQTPVGDIGLVSDLHGAHSDEEQIAALELADVLREALQTLDEETRGLLLLCVVEEVPYAEVAASYGVAVGTVKSRVHRARA
jgi:RNA polymerase sigma-70 factor (ECF subfamily)